MHLWVETPICSSRVDKWITLATGEPVIRFKHRIENTGRRAFPFMWKLHAAMAVDERSRIDMGAEGMLADAFGSPRQGAVQKAYTWPYMDDEAGVRHDIRRVLPADSLVSELHYATAMREGWCAVTHKQGWGFGLAFDKEVFRSCWLFASYGGWRNLNTVIIEPCTGYPVSLQEGAGNDTHQTLGPGETLTCEVTAVVYEGFREIRGIGMDGAVTGVEAG